MKSDFRLAIRLEGRVLLLGSASTAALLGQQDANETIRKADSADQANWKIARRYIFFANGLNFVA